MAICIANFIQAQGIRGQWNGALDIQGMTLTVVFNIEETEDGFKTTMDSPDQGAKGLPTTSTEFSDNNLVIVADDLGMRYEAALSANGDTLEGTFTQGPMELLLTMTQKKKEVKTSMRAQDPTDFPYDQEEVKFYNATDNIKLAGTLTTPSDKNYDQIVVLISGSGPQNRDEEVAMFNHRPFLVLSDYLTRNGVAVLRYDDRGVNESEGAQKGATSEDFARDVESAIQYIKSRTDLKDKKLGLVGHSEGGMIAPMVASKNDEVDFITLLAGPGTKIDELLLKQASLIGKTQGVPEDVLNANTQILSLVYDYIQENENMEKEELKAGVIRTFHDNLNIFPKEMLEEIEDKDQFIESQADIVIDDWFVFFLRNNPADYLSKVNCPVLAINGGLDLQVPADDNLNAIKAALTSAGNKNVTIKKFDNQNHLFQEAKTGAPSEYKEIEETFNEITLKYVTDWITSNDSE